MVLQPLAIAGAFIASKSEPDHPLASNAYLIERESGNVLIDPLTIDEPMFGDLERHGGVALVVILSADRATHAAAYAQRFKARIVERFSHRDEVFPGGTAVAVPNQHAGGAFAIALSAERTLCVGDVLAGSPAGGLSLGADLDGDAARQAALGLRAILRQNPKRILVARGQPLYADAFATLYRLLYDVAGAEIHRINLDALDRYDRKERPETDRRVDAEVGFEIGAKRLGYRVSTLLPGQRFCPLHAHAREEELFFVLDGNPSVRMLNGTIRCRKGDFIALPVGETGTHQLLNESDAPATVLLLARTDMPEICYYPDSDKVLVDTATPFIQGDASRMVRASPDLDYFDGELL